MDCSTLSMGDIVKTDLDNLLRVYMISTEPSFSFKVRYPVEAEAEEWTYDVDGNPLDGSTLGVIIEKVVS